MKKVVFITGSTSGFGEAIARMFAKENYNLIILGRRKEKLLELRKELSDIDIHVISCDIRDKKTLFSEIEKLPENFKNIDILVNNAGLALGQDKFPELDVEDFETMVDTNIKGLLYVTRAVLPSMVARKTGYIFNIGSVAGTWPYTGGNVYGGTKAFVKQFSKNLRTDLAGSNIRVTEIAPGIAKTEFSVVRYKGDVKKADSVYDGTKYITADDIAKIILDCVNMPEYININSLEVMPTTQSWAGFLCER